MPLLRPIAVVLLPLVAGCQAPADRIRWEPGSDGLPDEQQAVLEELEAYYADFSARDWEAFADHFWPGANLTAIWQPPGESAERVVATSVPAFVEKAPEGPGSATIFEEWMTAATLRVTSNGLAQAWVDYEARFGEPDALMEWSGVDAFTLMRFDGRWRIASLAYVAAQ